MYYINTTTHEYPLRTKNIRAENPHTSFSQIFVVPDHYKPVYPTDKPNFDEWTETVTELPPVEVNEVWTQQWQVVPRFTEYADEQGTIYTVEQQAKDYRQNRYVAAASEVRNIRDTLLVNSDWTQVLDAPVDRSAWAEYRQALRDITGHPGFPSDSLVWPIKPQ